MAASSNHANVLHNFKDNLDLVLTQIKDCESRRDDKQSFNETEYWKNLAVVFKLISIEATKLSMVYSKPPSPTQEECEALVTGLEKSILTLVSYYYSLPKTQGLTLRKELHRKVQELLERVKKLVENVSKVCGSAEQLHTTGQIWEEADNFDEIPKDNREATLNIINMTLDLVKDAEQEIEEALEMGGDDDFLEINETRGNEDEWSEADKALITAGIGLVKTVKSTLKKTKDYVKANGNCSCENNISQLDDLVDYIQTLSPIVDDMTVVLYPPIVPQSVQTKVDLLESKLTNILQFLKNSHVTSPGDEKWIDFLEKAKLHNVHNIKEKLNNV